MPRAVIYQCMWTVKDMERLQRLANQRSRSHRSGEIVFYADDESRMMRTEVIEESIWKVKCIRDALNTIPEEYRADIIESIFTGEMPVEIAHENTWKKWRRKFIRELAYNMNLI